MGFTTEWAKEMNETMMDSAWYVFSRLLCLSFRPVSGLLGLSWIAYNIGTMPTPTKQKLKRNENNHTGNLDPLSGTDAESITCQAHSVQLLRDPYRLLIDAPRPSQNEEAIILPDFDFVSGLVGGLESV